VVVIELKQTCVPLCRSSPYPERPSRMGIALNGQIFSKMAQAQNWLSALVEKWCDV
jgi:hypothetical protein